jgi:hypothetical protein
VPEESAMPKWRKSCEVVLTAVHLLHKRGLCVYKAIRPQNAMNLLHASVGIDDMLEYCLSNDSIKGPIGEGEVVGIANNGSTATNRDIGIYELQPRIFGKWPHFLSKDASTYNQNPTGRPLGKQASQNFEIRSSSKIYAQTRKHAFGQLCQAGRGLERGGSLVDEISDPEQAVVFVDEDRYCVQYGEAAGARVTHEVAGLVMQTASAVRTPKLLADGLKTPHRMREFIPGT